MIVQNFSNINAIYLNINDVNYSSTLESFQKCKFQ
jgi:hypothetical protein